MQTALRIGKIVLSVIVIVAIIGSLFVFAQHVFSSQNGPALTASVSLGSVSKLSTVSGFVETHNEAKLSFPNSGLIQGVLISKGDVVEEGTLLATLASAPLIAERNAALADIRLAKADYDELVAGREMAARSLTSQSLRNSEALLLRTIREENEKVDTARAILFSTDLQAYSLDHDEDATPPTITGTYTCEEESNYIVKIYSSNSQSGYSYRLEGIETGTYTAYTNQPAPLGTCGLYIQLAEDTTYNRSEWVITIPNNRSSTYATNYKNYQLALVARDNNIEYAENLLNSTERESDLADAEPREEEMERAKATILKAEAGLEAINARLKDSSVFAPRDGTITSVDVTAGELVNLQPIITLFSEGNLELTARIPEIDINQIKIGQNANVHFDADTERVFKGNVNFISPLPTMIGGVAYYETTIDLVEDPEWLRVGLNADIDIIIEEEKNTLRLPKRFVTKVGDTHFVHIKGDKDLTEVQVGLIGNDGHIEILGLSENTEVVLPQE